MCLDSETSNSRICDFLDNSAIMSRLFYSLLCFVIVGMASRPGVTVLATDDVPLRRSTTQEDPASLDIGRVVPNFKLDLLFGDDTTVVRLLEGRKGLVVCMTSTECPLAVRYIPRLASIEDEYSKRGIAFVFVNAVDAEKAADMQSTIRQNGLDGPYVADRGHDVQRATGARTTTEVFVLDGSRTLIYRGAVDDQFGIGVARDTPNHHFLRDALEAILTGTRPVVQATWPPGCVLDRMEATTRQASDLTYYGRIAHIIAEKCVVCHRQGGIAPFSLETAQSVKGRASMIDAVVHDRLMPPGHTLAHEPGIENKWVDDPALTDDDREAVLAWLRSDRSVGNHADGPTIPPLLGTWGIGDPDLIVTTPPLVLPVNGPLQYARFVVPTDLDGDRWISAVEFRPMERDSVHHALVWILPPGGELPKLTSLPTDLELLGVYSPADSIIRYTSGTARGLPAGSLLIIDLYARPMGRTKGSRLRTAMRFSSKRPSQEVRSLVICGSSLQIAPGASGVVHQAELIISSPTRIRAVTPYMRARGHSLKLISEAPKSDAKTILQAERYDFRWPIRYELKEAMTLPSGTKLTLAGLFDNSSAQLSNPDSRANIRAGPHAGDEALIAVFETEWGLPE